MIFNSYAFILLFLPVTWLVYFGLNHRHLVQLSKCWLLMASLYFYSYWNIKYLPLILISIFVNYAVTSQMFKVKSKKPLFWFGLAFNLGLLGYYKYVNFFLDNFGALTAIYFEPLKLILPLGISFYTLQQIAFLVDTYQGVTEEKKLIDYAMFVTFFPYVLSGPIAHYSDIMPQFETIKARHYDHKNFCLGVFLFVIGLSKKVIIADSLSGFVNDGFAHSEDLHFFSAWGTSLGYTIQLYFDFSGYTDMAIGLGQMFNVQLPQNFNSPLRAANINDFWARWHMTLSQYIRTYIFTPIVKLMPSTAFKYSMLSMFLAMTIAGIWHGAAWTFVIYGMIHGLAIVIHYNWKKRKKKLPYLLGWFVTFNFINFTFVIFRSRTLTEAANVLKGMLGLKGLIVPKMGSWMKGLPLKLGPYMTNDENIQLALIAVGFLVILKAKNSMDLQNQFEPSPRLASALAVLFVVCLFGMNRVSEFIYFNF